MNPFSRSLSTLVLASVLCVGYHAESSADVSDQQQVVEAVRLMFVAAANDDLAQFRSVTTHDFYAYDVGKRFTGDELMQVIKEAHAAGKTFVWEVTEPKAQVDGQTAWMTWVNRGSVEDAAGRTEVTWLESAVLRHSDGMWRICFLHSTRAALE